MTNTSRLDWFLRGGISRDDSLKLCLKIVTRFVDAPNVWFSRFSSQFKIGSHFEMSRCLDRVPFCSVHSFILLVRTYVGISVVSCSVIRPMRFRLRYFKINRKLSFQISIVRI